MDIEELNKTQIVLLTLLVSFVTSIATGIATVTLVEQAPTDVTRVINKVVERTIEIVKPVQGASVITKETTIIVKEEDAITETISLIKESSVEVLAEGGTYLGGGFVTSGGEFVVTDSALVSTDGSYTISFVDGATTTAYTAQQDERNGVAILKLYERRDGSNIPIGNTTNLKLGQSVLLLRESGKSVATGIISELEFEKIEVPLIHIGEDGEEIEITGTETFLSRIYTNIGGSVLHGTPLVNLFGEVIGISTEGGVGFLSSYTVTDLISKSGTHVEVTEDVS